MTRPNPRLPLIDDPQEPNLSRTFERVVAAMGRVPNLYRMLAHAPELLDAWIAFAWPLRHDPATERSTRELVIMRTAQLTGADYEWRQHWGMARAAGVSDAQLDELHRWPESTAFSPAEAAALRMTDALSASARLHDAEWRHLRSHYDDRACVELVMTAAFYQCVSRVIGGLGVPTEADVADVPGIEPDAGTPHLLLP